MRLMKTLAVPAAMVCTLLLLEAQGPPPNAPLLPPDQLDTLVAPIALYPDSLLSQILAASTYPLEIVELEQWLDRSRALNGEALIDAAREQGWDPSVAALAAFPDVVRNLNRDIRWTTDLGNAFLAQEGDVMSAVQRMRARAQANGRLQSNGQVQVTDQTEDGQTMIVIQPANPQVIYVPEYDPAWVWGPPAIGYYPPLWYPGVSVGFGFGSGIYLNGFFGGCCAWGGNGWGWQPRWFDHQIYVNNYFFNRYGYGEYHGGAFREGDVWEHSPEHRLGMPYANREVANRFRGGGFGGNQNFGGGFGGNARGFGGGAQTFRSEGNAGGFNGNAFAGANRGFENNRAFAGNANSGRGFGRTFERAPSERFGTQGFERANPGGNRSVFGGIHEGVQTRIQSARGFGAMRGGFSGGGFRGGSPAGHSFGGGGFHGGGRR